MDTFPLALKVKFMMLGYSRVNATYSLQNGECPLLVFPGVHF